MRIPLSLRAARACALATLMLSLGLAPSFAHMGGGSGPAARPGPGHSQHFAPHGFSRRFESGRFGFNRFNRFAGNQLLLGGGWGWDGLPPSGGSELIPAGDGAPIIINIGVDPGPGDAGETLSGGCVIHKLNYDNTGKYVGERQIPQC
jgi:hypothetical protein